MSSSVWDNVVISETAGVTEEVDGKHTLVVDYGTIVPHIDNYDIPSSFFPGEVFDVVLRFNVPVTFDTPPVGGTYLDHFIYEGAHLGTPSLYVSDSDTFPTLPVAADATTKEPPTGWSEVSGTSDASKVYLVRWKSVLTSAKGAFNLTLREGAVRGPVS